ncbi:MAG: histidine triad nucleotide-binding protein [Alphaproteobacteria bacterium]|nr:histidine triad nucleotide-binding protein [Alphaproteobacteria bacterium]
MAYDPNNVFARILRGEIPCKKLFETAHALAFHDIRPQTPVHVLVIPKGAYVSMEDFSSKATDAEIADFVRAVGRAAREMGVVDSGYRILANCGTDANQEVPHLHIHVFGGRRLGRMIDKPSG